MHTKKVIYKNNIIILIVLTALLFLCPVLSVSQTIPSPEGLVIEKGSTEPTNHLRDVMNLVKSPAFSLILSSTLSSEHITINIKEKIIKDNIKRLIVTITYHDLSSADSDSKISIVKTKLHYPATSIYSITAQKDFIRTEDITIKKLFFMIRNDEFKTKFHFSNRKFFDMSFRENYYSKLIGKSRSRVGIGNDKEYYISVYTKDNTLPTFFEVSDMRIESLRLVYIEFTRNLYIIEEKHVKKSIMMGSYNGTMNSMEIMKQTLGKFFGANLYVNGTKQSRNLDIDGIHDCEDTHMFSAWIKVSRDIFVKSIGEDHEFFEDMSFLRKNGTKTKTKTSVQENKKHIIDDNGATPHNEVVYGIEESDSPIGEVKKKPNYTKFVVILITALVMFVVLGLFLGFLWFRSAKSDICI